MKSDSEQVIESCKGCPEKPEEGRLLKEKSMIAFATPSISPTTSLSSSYRSFSSDFSVDGNFYDRGNQDECSSNSSQDEIDNMTERLKQNSRINDPVSRVHSSNALTEISNKRKDGDTWRDVEISAVDHQDAHKVSDQELEDDDNQMEAQIWEPPEAENPEDELEGGIADIDDDDDECCDGTEWSKSSILGDFRGEGNKSLKLKEEKQQAMQEVVNRKFKAVVSQLLRSLGVSSSKKDGENWVDIVTTLFWEAASLLEPVVHGGKPIDPTAYIKVKCIATGSRSQSQVFRGLVFKKHAAHKHMPTKYENPRILLLQGELGQSSSGLSSFKSMVQDKDYVKAVVDTIEAFHPNIVLVEKSVSRDVQESILSKRITLVFDMKLHRLERIARCTGSQIVSFDNLSSQKVKQCGSFHIEKFVEEHNACGEGGKKPSKTLMFLEGCPTCLGFTILLKGSHSDELKRVKEVVQYAFVLAYHLILETSFLVDQQTMFSTIPFTGAAELPPEKNFLVSKTYKLSGSCLDDSTAAPALNVVDIPISNGFHERTSFANGKTEDAKADTLEFDQDSVFSYEPYNPAIFAGFSSLSASIKKIIGNRFHPGSLSTYFGLVQDQEAVPVSVVSDASDNFKLIRDSAEDAPAKDAKEEPLLFGPQLSTKIDDGSGVQTEKDIETALESQSILVLVSRRNASRGIICEQSHFSHIMFYKNFDVPLGIFLRDMFNQGSQCKTCEELPEAHLYYYAHHNKQLTIQIKQLPVGKSLPGEAKGKLWMWSRCGKCRMKNGTSKSTKRVLISAAARSLSFGKFLELSFSQQSLPSRLSSCGHSLDTDFLHFFGLGSMVALFRYSWVTTYMVALPPPKLEVGSSIKMGWLEKEFHNVFTKTISLFEEVTSSLKLLRSEFTNSSPNHQGLLKDLSDIEEILKVERFQFEENIKNAFEKSKSPDVVLYKLLSLNRMRWELLLQAFVWDCRLRSLSFPAPTQTPTGESEKTDQGSKVNLDGSVCALTDALVEGNDIANQEILINGTYVPDHGKNRQIERSNIPEDSEMQTHGGPTFTATSSINHHFESHPADNFHPANYQEVDRATPVTTEPWNCQAAVSNGSALLSWQRLNEWFWLPFEEVKSLHIEDLERGYLSKSETVNSSTQENPTTMHQIISEEGSRLHISLGDDHLVVSDYEDELSSLIACALALLNGRPSSGESSDEESRNENRIPLMRCKHASLEGFLDKDSLNLKHNPPREDQRFPSFDGLSLLESLTPPEGLRKEVSFGSAKFLGKCKYSVVCLYADHFRDLRRRCCPSEHDYIASLSRCKPWDAKGGKSKSVFAKTLDDRFIVKEIKKTEYESFVKFAPEYFKYMTDSYDSGNQTCLAKVLGIYQVVIRQPKSGKEIRHDLMVMENLNYGRKITRQYDLKGALHARYTNSVDGAEDVLLDQNFVNDMNNSPLYVSNTSKRILQRAVWNDTSFLNSINVMDYSLLVGVDAEKQELVCGIIDYLRQYTWDKQLETWVKSSLVVPKNVLPTVISPREYKKRFRKFMSTHFFCVPDHWCSQGASDPCELCSNRFEAKQAPKER